MKKTAFVPAVVALLGVIGLGAPALAQNINNFTNINTFDSTFF
jgi:flagellar biosynthesis protein FliQ